jgi:uncharacterized protein YodC (DUF2158 family)
MTSRFKPGDIVNLKSSGPDMTVASVGDGIVNCIWFDGGTRQEKSVERNGFAVGAAASLTVAGEAIVCVETGWSRLR